MRDILGDKMKAFENAPTDQRAEKGKPLFARLDGRAFHTFTRGLKRPFDVRFSKLMIDTTKFLVNETDAVLGYTQSDEITLMWYVPKDSESQFFFDGRFQKIISVLASYATGFFALSLEDCLPEKVGTIPTFDCRAWQVPTIKDAHECFLWREQDAMRNSITMAASSYFSHKQLQGKSGRDKKQMMLDAGAVYEELPSFFRKGTFVQRTKTLRNLTDAELAKIPEAHRPTGPIERSEVVVRDFAESDLSEVTVEALFPSLVQETEDQTV